LRALIHDLPAVSISETLALGPGIVDLWWRLCAPMEDSELPAAYELLTPDERCRLASFRLERDRRVFLATRMLVRTALSQYAPVASAEWRFVVGPHGKPRIDLPVVTPAIHFNLANTPGLVVCAVSVAHDLLGVDVEPVDRAVEALGIADRYFCPSEAHDLRALPACQQPRRFIAYWTLKESYIKARGLGLALPLDQFRFLIADDAVTIAFNAPEAGDPTRWRFALIDAPLGHTIAVGVDTGGAALSLRVRQLEL
jgi:4'-phosphopantetheinyl transferase